MKTLETLTGDESHKFLLHFLKQKSSWSKSKAAHRNYLIALLMLDAGLRIGETVQLVIGDLLINGQPVESIRVCSAIAKNHKERVVPASIRIKDAIKLCQGYHWRDFNLTDSDYAFFTSKPDKHITRRQVQLIFERVSKQTLGFPINPHMLRHTFATRLMRVTSMKVVQQLLGHENIQTTQIYTHPDADDRQKAINAL